jgi:hypothetical protein
MVGHELETSSPIGDVEVCVAEPGVSVAATAAPLSFGHVVVKVDVNLLLCKFSCDGIVDLSSG